MEQTRQVEELGAIVDLRPEAVFQLLLALSQLLGILDHVQMGKHTHDLGHAVHLADVQKLENLHLEAVARVAEQQNQIGTLGHIDHGVDIVVALQQGDAALLGGHNGDGTLDLSDIRAGEALDQVLDQRRLAHFGRAHHGN